MLFIYHFNLFSTNMSVFSLIDLSVYQRETRKENRLDTGILFSQKMTRIFHPQL